MGTIDDVVNACKEYSKIVHDLENIHLPPPPCSDEHAATPPPDAESKTQLVLIYSILNTNEGQTWMWITDDMPVI